MRPLLIALFIPGILVAVDFIAYLFTGKQVLHWIIFLLTELASLIVLPLLFIVLDYRQDIDCCEAGAYFSPDHRLSIYVLIAVCLGFYFYSRVRKTTGAPIVELASYCFLLIGIVLNIFIFIQAGSLGIIGNIPFILLFLLVLIRKHRTFISTVDQYSFDNKGALTRFALYVLTLHPLQKFPLLLLLCVPFLGVMAGLLLLFGQKPDSMIKVFTETYRHGLSVLEPCECYDQHFLCTIAAKGHDNIVKPTRFGVRHGYQIKVNRQLLVSNAFEELLQEKSPWAHKHIRRTYNFIGGNFRRLYDVLGNKWISDVVYVAMKPLELLFLVTLYTFDRKPEDRIEKQYLRPVDRKRLEQP